MWEPLTLRLSLQPSRIQPQSAFISLATLRSCKATPLLGNDILSVFRFPFFVNLGQSTKKEKKKNFPRAMLSKPHLHLEIARRHQPSAVLEHVNTVLIWLPYPQPRIRQVNLRLQLLFERLPKKRGCRRVVEVFPPRSTISV